MRPFFIIAVVIFMMPFTAYSLALLPEAQMGKITGQAGVSIAADIDLEIEIQEVLWGDTDGIGGTSTGAWIGLWDLDATLHYGLRSDAGAGFDMADVELLTIDVATQAGLYNGASFVRIGLGTFELSGDIDFGVFLRNNNGSAWDLGWLGIYGLEILGGRGSYVDITTNGRASGVTLGLNVIIDEINISEVLWGDYEGIDHIDGYASSNSGNPLSSRGFVGFSNVAVRNVSVQGLLGIDTATLNPTNILGVVPSTRAGFILNRMAAYMWFNPGEISDTLTILSLGNVDYNLDASNGDLYVGIGFLRADTIVRNAQGDNVGVLGEIVIRNANVVIDGIVAIGAH